jgi:hypothetical protein
MDTYAAKNVCRRMSLHYSKVCGYGCGWLRDVEIHYTGFSACRPSGDYSATNGVGLEIAKYT